MPKKPPATPLTLIATAFQTPPRVALNWADVSTNETSFELQRCAGATCAGFVSLQTLSRNTQSTTDSTVVNGQTYRYRIRAVNSVGPSLWSNVATVVMLDAPPTPLPSAPTAVSATAGDGQITLAGTVAANVDTYTLKRGLTSGSETTLVTGLSTPNYVNTGLTNGTRYFYVFVSVKDGVSSLNSAEVSAVPTATTPPPQPPNPPTLTATAGTAQVSLNWSFVSGATYTLKRRTTGVYTTVASGLTSTSYVNTGLTGGTTYYFVVTATVSGLTSGQSNEVSATPTAQPTPPPDQSLLRYVATTGSNGSAGTLNAPWQTIAFALSQLVAGMTLYIRGGTYGEELFETSFGASGTSWNVGGYITIAGYPGETAILRPTGAHDNIVRFQDATVHHVLLQDLVIDGGGITHGAGPGSEADVFLAGTSHDIRLTNVEVKDSYGNGIVAAGSNYIFTNLNVHGCGREPTSIYSQGHNGLYGGGISNSQIIGGRYWGNKCLGIRLGSSDPAAHADNNIVDGAQVYDNGISAGGLEACGSLGGGILCGDTGNLAKNSLVYRNLIGLLTYGVGGKAPTNTKFYNNTVTGSTAQGVFLNGAAEGTTAPVNTEIRSNIIYGNGGAAIVDHGTGTVDDHNTTVDPIFVDAGNDDYRVQATSPALSAAVTLSQVPHDIVGVPRPQGTAPDCGAYERIVGSGGGGGSSYDFSMAISGPTHVVRGHSLYLLLDLALTTGARDYVNYTITGLPSGVTASMPDLEATCCGPFLQYEPAPTSLKLAASAGATTGSFTLGVTAVSGGQTRQVTQTITVDPVPSALPYTTPNLTAIPSLATWVSHMTTHGATHCATLTGGADANTKLGATYYDAERVYYQIATYTGDTATWNPCAAAAEAAYRDYFVIPNNGAIAGYWNFTTGLRMDYERTGDTTSKTAALALSQNAAFASASALAHVKISPASSREVAYALLSYINAEKLGYARNAKLGEDLDIALGHLDQWFVSINYQCPDVANYCPPANLHDYYIQPFMIGLTMEALIAYYEEIDPDPRIPVAVKTAADWLWIHAWYAPYQLFWYENWTSNPASIPAGYWAPASTPSTSADLNLLIAPAYAWLYTLTGDNSYRDNGDAIFAGGVATAYLLGAKQFNQNYKWSFAYVSWRTP